MCRGRVAVRLLALLMAGLATVALSAGCVGLHGPAAPASAFADRILPPLNLLPLMPSAREAEDAWPTGSSHLPRPGGPVPAAQAAVLATRDGPLTLPDALAIAEQSNPRLLQMRARVDIARAGRTVAFADFLPEAKTYLRHVQGVPASQTFALPTIPTLVGNVATGEPSDSFWTAELHLQMTVFQFGRQVARYGQAVAATEIAELQYQRALQTVGYDVTVAYLTVLRERAMRRIAEEAVVRAEAVLKDARNFKKRGDAIRNDVLRAEVLVSEARLNLVRARTAEGVGVAALNQVMGTPVTAPLVVADPPPPVEPDLSLAVALQTAVDNRQEFAVALEAVRSAQLGTEVARADFLPRVVVGADAIQQKASGQSAVGLFEGGIGIELELFEGGRRLGRLRSAQAEVALAIAQGQEICDRIAFEVDAAYLGLNDARQRMGLARTDLEQATENLRVVRRQFDKGDATPTDVVDAELAMVRGQENEANALYGYQTAVARLAYAMGVAPDALNRGGTCPPAEVAAGRETP
jgi:outer membrane protein TolC